MKPHGITTCPKCDAFVRVADGRVDEHWIAFGSPCTGSNQDVVYDDDPSPGRVVAAVLICALAMVACAVSAVQLDWRYALGLPVIPLLAAIALCRKR